MFYDIALYVSLAIFGIGMIYKTSNWFRRSIGINPSDITTSKRISAAVKGILGTVFSRKIFILIKVFFVDVILQIKILREDFLRWLMHILIYGGFMLLLLMHALDGIITEALFSNFKKYKSKIRLYQVVKVSSIGIGGHVKTKPRAILIYLNTPPISGDASI